MFATTKCVIADTVVKPLLQERLTPLGATVESVSLSAGSRRLMRGRMRMPLRESAGIWMASCTNTPNGTSLVTVPSTLRE